MAARATRGQIAHDGDYFLTVAPQTGETAKQMPALLAAAVSGQQRTSVWRHEQQCWVVATSSSGAVRSHSPLAHRARWSTDDFVGALPQALSRQLAR